MHTNNISNHSYIGFTSREIDDRLWEHINDSKKGSKLIFHQAIRKYGIDEFSTRLLDETSTQEHAKVLEIFYIKLHNTYRDGYNMTSGGDGGDTLSNHPDKINIGKRISLGQSNMSPESKKRMNEGKRRVGKDNGMFGVHRYGKENPFYGGTHTEEAKQEISAKSKIRTSDPNWVSPVKGVPKTKKQLETTSRVNSRTFKFIFGGLVVTITNLASFCKNNELSYGCMTHVNAGRNKSHKGYTRFNGSQI